jgi:pimeloyl-ACP methyl ester carboxylesterase
MKIEIATRSVNAVAGRPALLFIHGGFHGAWCWDEHFLPWFAERGWPAHALSLRGHGGSEGREQIASWTLADYCSDVLGVVGEIGGPVVLIGHSMGGVIAQQCWARRKDIAGLALVASSPLRPSPSVVWRLFRERPVSFLRGQLLKDPEHLLRAMEPILFSPGLPQDRREAYRRQLCPESPKAVAEVFARPPPRVEEGDDRPVLVIAGAGDWSIPLSSHEQTRRAYDAPLEICPGAHDLMLDPEWRHTARTLETWLTRVFR